MLVTGLSIGLGYHGLGLGYNGLGLGYHGLGYGYHGLPVIAAAAETAEETAPNPVSRAVST